MRFILALAAAGIIGCAQSPLSTPSGEGVTGGIGRTSTSVSQAQKYNDVAVTHNANASTNVQRIEAKAAVIEKYWK